MTPSRTWALLTALLLLGVAACGDTTRNAGSTTYLPDEEMAFAISSITVLPKRSAPMMAMAEALDILGEIRRGRPFADVARARSQDKDSASKGGFQGFWKGSQDEALTAGIQAIPMGAVSSPIESPSGVHLIQRHTFEEARRLEAASAVAAYGLFVPWAKSVRPAPRSREEAEALATKLRDALANGTMTMAAAYAEVHGGPPERDDLLIGVVRDLDAERKFYEALRAVEPGAWLPIMDFPGGLTVVKRGKLLRTLVRQILIQHAGSLDRQMAVHRTEEEARRLAERVASEAKADGSNWAELVKRHSDDALSQPLLGFIGCVANGELVAPLETALQAAPPGAVYRHVVETQRGFHILFPVK